MTPRVAGQHAPGLAQPHAGLARQQPRHPRPSHVAAAEPVMRPTEGISSAASPSSAPEGAGRGRAYPSVPVQPGTYVPPSRGQLPAQRYGMSLWDSMKFWGPGPELINGRLAMVAIVLAATRESSGGELIAEQAGNHPFQVTLLIALITFATLVPITKGVRFEAFGPFTPVAEQVNGRAAQLAFAALLYLESKAGVPFF